MSHDPRVNGLIVPASDLASTLVRIWGQDDSMEFVADLLAVFEEEHGREGLFALCVVMACTTAPPGFFGEPGSPITKIAEVQPREDGLQHIFRSVMVITLHANRDEFDEAWREFNKRTGHDGTPFSPFYEFVATAVFVTYFIGCSVFALANPREVYGVD